jgi:hypothetical protein
MSIYIGQRYSPSIAYNAATVLISSIANNEKVTVRPFSKRTQLAVSSTSLLVYGVLCIVYCGQRKLMEAIKNQGKLTKTNENQAKPSGSDQAVRYQNQLSIMYIGKKYWKTLISGFRIPMVCVVELCFLSRQAHLFQLESGTRLSRTNL